MAHMVIHPWGAVLIGLIAGASCTAGYEYFQVRKSEELKCNVKLIDLSIFAVFLSLG